MMENTTIFLSKIVQDSFLHFYIYIYNKTTVLLPFKDKISLLYIYFIINGSLFALKEQRFSAKNYSFNMVINGSLL